MSEKSKYNGGFRKSDSRDRSADELRYSIRSLIEYLPWHSRTLYILTNNQIPKWLDTTYPRIQMVFHKDIFPEHITPTYDSSTIELFLDKIPGLTECFIYFNDDFFANNYIHPAYFFTSKTFYPKVYRSDRSRFRSPYKLHFLYLYHTFLQYATRDEDFPNKFGGNRKAREFKGYTLPANRTIEKYSVEIVPPKIIKSFIKYAQDSDVINRIKIISNILKIIKIF